MRFDDLAPEVLFAAGAVAWAIYGIVVLVEHLIERSSR
ncbi:hypothetical protein EV379_3126 [Microterricola gilva]|uniref:Uncharacterized protein n=1 Tax=Microterricola gilva TaxID=393267 RepID=A0A4Q8APY7_9MICO|nr:hypothetical protein EV379_3126 [Microterricola gilva]